MPRSTQLNCKNCGGELSVDEQGKYLLCPFCGSRRLIIEGDAVTVEKIRQQTAFKQWEREDNERKERERAVFQEHQEKAAEAQLNSKNSGAAPPADNGMPFGGQSSGGIESVTAGCIFAG